VTLPAIEKLRLLPAFHELMVQRVEPLTPDASERRYFRLFPNERKWGDTVVAMCLAVPESGESAFENVQRYLLSSGLPVPKIYMYDSSLGIMLLEDLADISLESYVSNASERELVSVYKRALDICLDFEFLCKRETSSCVAFSLVFDYDKLMWEFDFFIRHMIMGLNGVSLSEPEVDELKSLFAPVLRVLTSEPTVFAHRDFHSRNIMVKNGKLRIIDFQDARLGPCQYDVASLLRDSYVQFSDTALDELLDYYLSEKEKRHKPVLDRGKFRKVFDYMSIQRNLKAVGTFSFQVSAKKNLKFDRWIVPTIGYVRNNLVKYPELKCFARVLGKYVQGVCP